jgi:hypothetical protein
MRLLLYNAVCSVSTSVHICVLAQVPEAGSAADSADQLLAELRQPLKLLSAMCCRDLFDVWCCRCLRQAVQLPALNSCEGCLLSCGHLLTLLSAMCQTVCWMCGAAGA